jgi:hypothetical protein
MLIMEMEGGEGGSEVHGVDGLGVRQISGISAREFRVVRVGSYSGAALPEGVNGTGPLVCRLESNVVSKPVNQWIVLL